jgi:hypothetical protein
MARYALLIGVSEFVDERLARLNAPINDVIALRGILQDSSRGNFNSVELSLNEDYLPVRDRLSRLFRGRAPDDLLLLYYSGHGILGRSNRLFLATAGSDLDGPGDRSISARDVREFVDDSRATRQIVILDCCHSGAFAEHAKAAAAPAVTEETFSASDAGLYVLTAADALQFAWDGADLRVGSAGATGFSQFTSWLVDGLEKGEAAPDNENITMDALYRYLFRRARSAGAASTPHRFVQGGVGDLVISANPLVGTSQIDPETIVALAAENWHTRLGAVAELTQQMRNHDAITARAAGVVLQRHLNNPKQPELNYRVRDAITNALAAQTEAPRPAAEEKRQTEAARQAEKEQWRAEVPRQTEEGKRRVEEEKQWTKAPPRALDVLARQLRWHQRRWSGIGIATALLPLLFVPLNWPPKDPDLLFAMYLMVVSVSLASGTFLVVISGWRWPAYVLSCLNPLLFMLFTIATCVSLTDASLISTRVMLALFALAFAIESAVAVSNVWFPDQRRSGAKPK